MSRQARVLTVAGVVVGAAAGLGHWAYLGRGPTYAGPLLVAHHLFGVLAAAALLFLCTGLGTRILDRVGLRGLPPLERIPFAAATGMGAAGTVLLLAGTVGLLRPLGVFATLALLAVLSRSAFPPTVEALRRLPADLVRAVPEKDLRVLLLAVGALVAAFLLVVSLLPPADHDALMYHLDVPAEFLLTGRFRLPQDNLHVGLVGPVHLLFLPLLALGAPAAPAVLSALLGLLLAIVVLALAARYLSPASAVLGAVALWGNGALLLVAVTPRLDATVALYLILGHFALLLALDERAPQGRMHYLVGAGLLGVAVAVKLQALAYIAALAPMAVWIAWRRPWAREGGGGFGAAAGALAAFALVGVAAGLPWHLKNVLLLGAPFYPILAEHVLPPWLATIAGTRAFPATVDPYVLQVLGEVREPFGVVAAFLSPGRLTVEGEGRFYFLSPLLALLPLAVVVGRNRAVPWLLLGGLGYLAAILLPFPRTNLRYLIPGLVPLTLVAVHGLWRTLERLVPSREARLNVATVIVLLSLLPAGWGAAARLAETGAHLYAVGLASEAEVLTRQGNVPELRDLVHRYVPPEGRVLMLFDARGFGLGREVLQDNYLTNWPLLHATGAPEGCLEGTGITHVLLAPGVAAYYLGRGMDPARMQLPALNAFARRCLETVARSPSLVLYRVQSGETAPESLR